MNNVTFSSAQKNQLLIGYLKNQDLDNVLNLIASMKLEDITYSDSFKRNIIFQTLSLGKNEIYKFR